MQIPTIRQSGGVFEIFVPGIFFLFNLVFSAYLIFQPYFKLEFLKPLKSNLGISLIVIWIICLGYLLGMILRLFRSSKPDKISTKYYSFFKNKNSRLSYLGEKGVKDVLKELELPNWTIKQIVNNLEHNDFKSYSDFRNKLNKIEGLQPKIKFAILNEIASKSSLWAIEPFPYIKWIGIVVKYNLPDSAAEFYEKVWKEQLKLGGNMRFFNFCKRLIFQKDDPIIDNLVSSETTVRYLSGMTYALMYTIITMLMVLFFRLILFEFDNFLIVLILLLFLYVWSFLVIVKNYKYLRIREVELLFDISFKYRNELKKQLNLTITDNP